MPRSRKKRLVSVKLLTSAGVVRRYRIRGKKEAYGNPKRVVKNRLVNQQGNPTVQDYIERYGTSRRAPPPPAAEAPAGQRPPPSTTGGFLEEPPATIDRERTTRRGATYLTFFKASGIEGRLEEIRNFPKGKSPQILSQSLDEFAAPRAWHSEMILHKVRWSGERPLRSLINELNLKLQFAGEETRAFDFRDAYTEWEYRYQVLEVLGPTVRVVKEINDSSARY